MSLFGQDNAPHGKKGKQLNSEVIVSSRQDSSPMWRGQQCETNKALRSFSQEDILTALWQLIVGRIRHIWSWFASSVSSENVLYFWCFRRTKSRSRRWDGCSRMDETPGSSPNANSCSFQFWNKFPLLLFGYYSLGVLADSMRLLLPIHLRGLANLPRGSWRHFSTCRARMREEYVRDRKNVNIVTLGASQHGKTLLCSRLTEALSDHGVPVKKVDGIGFRVFYEIVQRCPTLTTWRQRKRAGSLSRPHICSFGVGIPTWHLGWRLKRHKACLEKPLYDLCHPIAWQTCQEAFNMWKTAWPFSHMPTWHCW